MDKLDMTPEQQLAFLIIIEMLMTGTYMTR